MLLLGSLSMAVQGQTATGLPPSVTSALARANVPKEAVAMVVQEVGADSMRLAWQKELPMNPASVMKLLTTDAALEILGPAYSWSTPVWITGPVSSSGVLDGDLTIKGTGDPKLVIERLWLLLRRVQQLGVREIRGDIVLDRSAFSGIEQNPADFDGEPLRPYNATADALLLNFKAQVMSFTPDPARGVAWVSADVPLAGWRVETSVPLAANNTSCGDWKTGLKADFSDPARWRLSGTYPAACGEKYWPVAYTDAKSYNARAISGLWQAMGGKLTGTVRDGVVPSGPPQFELVSPALSELVRDINKVSNNVMAQQLFLTLGLKQRGTGHPEAAREVMQQWLKDKLADEAQGVSIDNGSGLSLKSRINARQLTRLLQLAYSSPVMPELMSSLPVVGVDGTLANNRSGAAGRAHLKSGSMPRMGIAARAGYVLATNGRRYVMVGIINHANAQSALPALDALLQWTANPPATGSDK